MQVAARRTATGAVAGAVATNAKHAATKGDTEAALMRGDTEVATSVVATAGECWAAVQAVADRSSGSAAPVYAHGSGLCAGAGWSSSC